MNISYLVDFIRVAAYTVSLSILLPLLSLYTSQLVIAFTTPKGLEEKISTLKLSRDSLQERERELSKIISTTPTADKTNQNDRLKTEIKEFTRELENLQEKKLKQNNLIALLIGSLIGILALLFSYFSASNYLSPGVLLGGTFCLISATTYTHSLMMLAKVISIIFALIIIVFTGYRQSNQRKIEL